MVIDTNILKIKTPNWHFYKNLVCIWPTTRE